MFSIVNPLKWPLDSICYRWQRPNISCCSSRITTGFPGMDVSLVSFSPPIQIMAQIRENPVYTISYKLVSSLMPFVFQPSRNSKWPNVSWIHVCLLYSCSSGSSGILSVPEKWKERSNCPFYNIFSILYPFMSKKYLWISRSPQLLCFLFWHKEWVFSFAIERYSLYKTP